MGDQVIHVGRVAAQGPQGERGPQGLPGIPGASGQAATINIGTVTTGAAGSQASVTNVGSSSAAKFNFVIPRGDKGDNGAPGPQGPRGIPNERLSEIDTRSTNEIPNWYLKTYGRSIVTEFKNCANIKVNTILSGTFCNVTTIVPWADSTGGMPVQFAVNTSSDGIGAYRASNSNGTGWTAWTKLGAKGDKGDKGNNGRGITSISSPTNPGKPGVTDTYTIHYSDNTTSDFKVTNGVVGSHGAPGQDGITPHIGDNGNWFIGTKDTGTHAQGPGGLTTTDATTLKGASPYNKTSAGPCGWASAATDAKRLVTNNTLAYFNGAYSGTTSNLLYCQGGKIASQTWVNDNAITKTNTNEQTLKGNLKVKERLTFVNTGNPLVDFPTPNGKHFYMQAYSNNMALGPTSTIATVWDINGNMEVKGPTLKAIKIIENGLPLNYKYVETQNFITSDFINLLSDLQMLDYIETNGNQYIDTNFIPNPSTTKIIYECAVTRTLSSWGGLYGQLRYPTDNQNIGIDIAPNTINLRLIGTGNYANTFNSSVNTHLVITEEKGTIEINNQRYTGITKSTSNLTHSLVLGRYRGSSNVVAGGIPQKIYSCKIYDNNTLIRDMIPCKKNNVQGLLDLVYDVFYPLH